jgi:hypothetical protein
MVHQLQVTHRRGLRHIEEHVTAASQKTDRLIGQACGRERHETRRARVHGMAAGETAPWRDDEVEGIHSRLPRSSVLRFTEERHVHQSNLWRLSHGAPDR